MTRDYNGNAEIKPYKKIEDIMFIFGVGSEKAYAIAKIPGFPTMKMGREYLFEHYALLKWIFDNRYSDFSDL